MSLRVALAQKYAGFTRPKQFRSGDVLALKACDVSPSLVKRTRVSSNALLSLDTATFLGDMTELAIPVPDAVSVAPVLREPPIADQTGLLAPSVEVSDNLLTPLGGPEARGKNYAIGDTTDTLFGDRDVTRVPSRERKAYSEARTPTGVLTKGVSLWDLILPLLKPPLNLDFPTQIDLPHELYPYQIDGVGKLLKNDSFLLADDMGTGKTVMSCVALRILFQKGRISRALIVAPKNILRVWDDHLRDWAGPAITCTVVGGTREQRECDWQHPAHVYVCNFASFQRDVLGDGAPLATEEARKRFDLLIADEAHHIKNPGTKKARAVLAMQCGIRWALTGTPVQNRIEDLVAIFRFVKPGLFPSTDIPTPAQARETARPYFLRRRKAQVLPELPEKVRQNIWLEMDPEQREAYDSYFETWRQRWYAGARDSKSAQMHIFSLITKLKQVCNFAPGATSSPKLDQLLEQLDEIVDEHKACVFTQYRTEGVDKLRPHLERYGVLEIHGNTPHGQRAKTIDDFQHRHDVRILLATTKSGGEGITLTAGNYVFHFDQWWNPASAWQAEDRVHRKGQSKQVTVYSYWMLDTYEERIYRKLEELPFRRF